MHSKCPRQPLPRHRRRQDVSAAPPPPLPTRLPHTASRTPQAPGLPSGPQCGTGTRTAAGIDWYWHRARHWPFYSLVLVYALLCNRRLQRRRGACLQCACSNTVQNWVKLVKYTRYNILTARACVCAWHTPPLQTWTRCRPLARQTCTWSYTHTYHKRNMPRIAAGTSKLHPAWTDEECFVNISQSLLSEIHSS
jgi:hypothetical protein